jgi:hypothetical protein
MAKVVHLTSDAYRAWRMSHYVLVDEEERIVRPAKRGEVEAFEEAQKVHRTLQVRVDGKICTFRNSRDLMKRAWFGQYGDCIIKASNGRFLCAVRDPKIARPTYQQTTTGRSAPMPHECECRLWGDPHPGKHHPFCNWNKFAPKPEKADARKKLEESVVVVDASEVPEVAEPELATASQIASGNPIAAPAPAPDPSICVCREWPRYGGPPEGHNIYCQYHEQWKEEHPPPKSVEPPPVQTELIEEIADVKKISFDEPEEPATSAEGRSARVVTTPKKVPSPEECECRKWERKDGTEGHNPICEHHAAWELQQRGLMMHYVYDFIDREQPIELRAATFEEVEEAQRNEGSAGNPIIYVGEDKRPYLVAMRDEVQSDGKYQGGRTEPAPAEGVLIDELSSYDGDLDEKDLDREIAVESSSGSRTAADD